MRRLVFSISMALAAAFGATAASADGNLSAAAATEGNVVWSLESVVSSVLSDNTLVVTEGFLFQGKDAFDGVAAVEKTGMAVRVWPNPVTDMLTVAAEGTPYSWTVTAVDGSVAASGSCRCPEERLDLSALPAGGYILTITTEQSAQSVLIIKK